MHSLARKVLVIIGGTSGLGLSAAKAFTNEGAKVIFTGRDNDKVESANREIGENGVGFVADAVDPNSAVRAIDLAIERFGGFDGLYHVAGGSGRRQGDGPIHQIPDDGWSYTITENLTSVFFSNRAAVQRFLQLGHGGAILNMSSVLASSPSPKFFETHAYATAKAGIIGLTRTMAASYATLNIRCNAIAPALVSTPMSERAQGNEAIRGFIQTKQPLDGGRFSVPADLDAAAIFLMSDASRLVTGQILAVDGGWSVSEGQIP